VAKPRLRLSALIVARNEEHNLRSCLTSVSWADERVVVVDSSSDDATLEIARRHADIVLVRSFDDFASQRNAALGLATGDWVLSIDADERATPELADEIRNSLTDPDNPHVGFRVPIRSEILGRPFAYSGTQKDLPIRLFRRERGKWTGLVHEIVQINGSVGRLRHPLQHRTIPNIRIFLRKMNEYTSLEALGLYQRGRRYRVTDLTFRPVWTFLKLYVIKQGFRDGMEGLMFCALSGVSVAVRAWKLRELVLARGAS
jgi:glycosyltransferase involved in cell wall biosynthesis